MPWPERIIVDPKILAREASDPRHPVGSRVHIGTACRRPIREPDSCDYSGLTREDILACLSFASYLAHEYKTYPIPAWMRLLADGDPLVRGSRFYAARVTMSFGRARTVRAWRIALTRACGSWLSNCV